MIVRCTILNQKIEGDKTTMISKEQFLTIKRMKANGVQLPQSPEKSDVV